MIIHEIKIFFTALMFYTRIPCPKWVDHREAYVNQSTRYFPLIGWIVGVIAGVVYLIFSYLINPIVGVLFSITASILTTGAFHEDGLADVCDGFGGGWTKDKILVIMKDSRIGTYGVTGLILIILFKVALLIQIISYFENQLLPIVLVFITAHALSRLTAASFIFTHPYVRDTDDSKAKPVAKKVKLSHLLVAICFGLLPLIGSVFYFKRYELFVVLLSMYLAKVYLGKYFTKWIGGYTGDCLGATQQISEIVFYLSFVVLWKFI
ncbi:adenosylcobinamide-GDP ribazoletransferase [Fulvivirgaceae bacterium BMA10]|uniref:Adenosylcobinamide-GDP ribazoletransferase n=1 Tax=Splendidivirga corallicola TaxID=3051826 RepID=A0ABT8KXH5_9BACT|nr:adenosylcobinamide-GDP ribazoletransferase [Fulvivirgaceae bacterium BMA10]